MTGLFYFSYLYFSSDLQRKNVNAYSGVIKTL